jgi:hypothetical protein
MKKRYTFLFILWLLCTTTGALAQPKLSSYTTAPATIYLDLNGHYVVSSVWNGGNPINCASPNLSDAQVTEIFNRVAEDFRPFDVNITTDSAVFLAAPLDMRIRIIVTPTSAWRPGVGGIAYTGSFIWGDDTPGFVFSDRLGPNNPKMVGEACSHEAGHTVGLSHQSRWDGNCTLTETYNTGNGLGEIAWAPIMGNSYYRNMSGWNDGPTQFGCGNTQDNLSIITTQNGFGYRTDDFSHAMDATTALLNTANFSANGVISTTTDKDAFRFVLTGATNLRVLATPFAAVTGNDGANLDIKMQLYNAAQQLLRTYDNAGTMNAVMDTALPAGTYYLLIDGAGNANISDYGSLGSYTLSGFSGTLPIRSVQLTGSLDNNGRHILNWSILSDEPLQYITAEVSLDGSRFSPLHTLTGTASGFAYQPYETGDLYYRLHVVSAIGEKVYSNIIKIKNSGKVPGNFSVSTLVNAQLLISAAENYRYAVSDLSGRVLMTGSAAKGINKLNMDNKPAGVYVIQLFGENETFTSRIIKQ